LDPLLWISYEALCELGATDIDPTSVFGVRPAEIDKLQERILQQKSQAEMPLQEKSILTPHHFSPPTPVQAMPAAGVSKAKIGGRAMDLGSPLGTGSIGPKASIFQTAEKSMQGAVGQTVPLPGQLQFDTPNLTPIPVQQDASFVQHHHFPLSATMTATDRTALAGARATFDFVDTHNPNIVRRAKHVAARLYYQPSPETPYDFAGPSLPSSALNFGGRYSQHFGAGPNAVGGASSGIPGASSPHRYLRGKSALWSEAAISDTPLRRGGGRPSDISTTRRPRALFLSENKAMRENTNGINHNLNGLEDDDHVLLEDDENYDRRRLGQDGGENNFVVEGLEDLEESNVMTDDGSKIHGGPPSFLVGDEKTVLANSPGAGNNDVASAMDEDIVMDKHGSVQQILELFCLLGAGYWRLCQVSNVSLFVARNFLWLTRLGASKQVLFSLSPFFSIDAGKLYNCSEPCLIVITTLDGSSTKKEGPILKWQTTKMPNVAWSSCSELNLIE
jgi:hypothetical protein